MNMVRLITWAQSIYPMLGYVIENTPFKLDQSPRILHIGQALPWKAALTRCGTMRFLCALAAQLVDQPCTTLSFAVGSDIHHHRPQPASFSHIG
jgi:hypothetical protein